jgi:repressor LexA
MPRLTPRQHRILTYIRDHTREVGYPPTVREIGEHTGLASTASVHRHLLRLEEKGLLRRRAAGRSRAVVLTRPTAPEAA